MIPYLPVNTGSLREVERSNFLPIMYRSLSQADNDVASFQHQMQYSIVKMQISRRLRWTKHVVRMEETRNAY
jgi:hypothetical protein